MSGNFFFDGLRTPIDLREENITRHVDQYRPASTAERNVKSLPNRRNKFACVFDLEIVFRDGHCNIEYVRFLKGVATQKRGVDLPRYRHDGYRIHKRRRNARDQIRRAGSRSGHAHADFARRPCVTVGSVRRVLFVCHQNLSDFRFVDKRVVQRQNHSAGVAENHINATLAQAFDNRPCSRHQHKITSSKLVWRKDAP